MNLDENLESLIVSITSADEYFLSIGVTGDDRESMDLQTVGLRVSQIMSANPEIQVLVEGDTNADWGAMITLITTLNSAGVINPSFITQPRNEL